MTCVRHAAAPEINHPQAAQICAQNVPLEARRLGRAPPCHALVFMAPCTMVDVQRVLENVAEEETRALSAEGPGARVGASVDEWRLAAHYQKLQRLRSVATFLGDKGSKSAAKIPLAIWRARRRIRACRTRARAPSELLSKRGDSSMSVGRVERPGEQTGAGGTELLAS